MDSLKIKQKHLLLAALVLILGAGLSLYWVGIQMVFSNNLPLPQLVAPAKTYIFLDSRNGEIVGNYQSYDVILPKYLKFIEKESNLERINQACFRVGKLYYELHSYSEAKEYLLPLLDCANSTLATDSAEILAAIAYHTGEIDRIPPMVDSLQARFPDKKMSLLQSWRLNALAKATEDFEDLMTQYNFLLAKESNPDLKKELMERKANITWQLAKGQGKIQGYVEMVSGKKLANIPVYLTTSAGTKTITPTADLPVTYTDADGYYQFTDLPSGTYNVGIELRQDLFSGNVTTNTKGHLVVLTNRGEDRVVSFKIHPEVKLISPKIGEEIKISPKKVKFRWKEFEGAAYYTFSVASYYRLPATAPEYVKTTYQIKQRSGDSVGYLNNFKGIEKIQTTQVEIDFSSTDNISRREFPLGFILPHHILGWKHPGSQIIWRVQAFDEKGNLIGDSNNQIDPDKKPYIVFTGGELQSGDEELLAGQYYEALAIYLTELAKSPQDKTLFLKVEDMVAFINSLYGSAELMDVLKNVHAEVPLPESITKKYESVALWETAIQRFLLGLADGEVPFAWYTHFAPITDELDGEELALIRLQVMEGTFDADLEYMEGASITRLICGVYFKWLTDKGYRLPGSEQYKLYVDRVLAKSGPLREKLEYVLSRLGSSHYTSNLREKIPR